MSKSKFKQQRIVSGREARRMGERELKRQEKQKAIQAWWNLKPEERQQRVKDEAMVQRICQNGITIDDLDRVGQESYNEGAKQGAENTMKCVYAAVALVMHEKYGFGKKRCLDVLNAIDEKVIYALTTKEMVQRVWDEIGLEISFDGDALDERVKEKV